MSETAEKRYLGIMKKENLIMNTVDEKGKLDMMEYDYNEDMIYMLDWKKHRAYRHLFRGFERVINSDILSILEKIIKHPDYLGWDCRGFCQEWIKHDPTATVLRFRSDSGLIIHFAIKLKNDFIINKLGSFDEVDFRKLQDVKLVYPVITMRYVKFDDPFTMQMYQPSIDIEF